MTKIAKPSLLIKGKSRAVTSIHAKNKTFRGGVKQSSKAAVNKPLYD